MRALRDAILTAAVMLAVWFGFVTLTKQPPYILPGPDRVALALIEHRALLFENTLRTAATMIAGFIAAMVAAILAALMLVSSALARRWLLPPMIALQAIPLIALAPVLALWLGYTSTAAMVATVLVLFFPVTLVFYDGLRRTDPGLLDLAQTMSGSGGGRGWRRLAFVRIPAALPALGSGMKLGAIYAPIAVWIGEWVSGSKGLAYVMLYANGRLKVDLMFAALILLAVFALLFHAGVRWLAARMTPWQSESNS